MLLPYFAFSVSMKAWDEIEIQRVVKESFYYFYVIFLRTVKLLLLLIMRDNYN